MISLLVYVLCSGWDRVKQVTEIPIFLHVWSVNMYGLWSIKYFNSMAKNISYCEVLTHFLNFLSIMTLWLNSSHENEVIFRLFTDNSKNF